MSDNGSLTLPGRRRRSEDLGITFADDFAEAWAFGVRWAFRDQLDIRWTRLKDHERSTPEKTVWKNTWTRGVPPLFAFDQGHVFYEPPLSGACDWEKTLRTCKRRIQVIASSSDDAGGAEGWVEFDIQHFRDGAEAENEHGKLSQGRFAEFLRTGELPSDMG